jgi:hypothetical protein
MLSVYTRHAEDCKHYRDKLWRRCNCPKWIWGSHNGEFVRMSARTRLWDDAERVRHRMEFPEIAPLEPEILPPSAPLPLALALPPAPAEPQLGLTQKTRVTIKAAVNAYLADAVSRELAPSTISKLETMFRKQFLVWCEIAGLEDIDQIDLDALLNFRNTWKDGRLAKQKKQSRLIGFFWACPPRLPHQESLHGPGQDQGRPGPDRLLPPQRVRENHRHGVERKAHYLVMDLPHSDDCFVAAFPAWTTEAFLEGHVGAFAYFGGVPTRILYDNSKIAVVKILGGAERQRTRVFSELESHYLFADKFGRPAKGNDKGKVEGLVGYARRNFMVPIPRVPNWEEWNTQLESQCRRRRERRLRGHAETIGERFERDRAALLPLPIAAYEACEKVSSSATLLTPRSRPNPASTYSTGLLLLRPNGSLLLRA